ncbi:MAG: segregation/condensation protein A [Coriobacteriales bacterium]|jgi:segregation and condensation protein A|nr:segregation/condensation protein A [Coriobacteriales bacterium]
MPYNIKIAEFEGPFDLLLHLVSQQKLDIAAIRISQIADQYLAYIEKMRQLDLDVASDFLVVAAQLLSIKARSIVAAGQRDEAGSDDDELDELSPDQAKQILIERLIAYKQFKNVAAWMGARYEAQSRLHVRNAFLEPRFAGLMPDFLRDTTLADLARICAELASRRQVFLLEAEHIMAEPISLPERVAAIDRVLAQRPHQTFRQLVADADNAAEVVVSFLAILQLYHDGSVDLIQKSPEGEIEVNRL